MREIFEQSMEVVIILTVLAVSSILGIVVVRIERRKRRNRAQILEEERLEAERFEVERLEAERFEAERLEAERFEAERLEAERLEAERLEAERLEAERLEAERLEAERLEAERLEAERLEAERLEAERLEAERLEAERLEAERLEAERLENLTRPRPDSVPEGRLGRQSSSRQLSVFISSTMDEFRDLRDLLSAELEKQGLEVFLYEKHAGARPENLVEASLGEVAKSDIFVAIFGNRYGEVTRQEFECAKENRKPNLVYIRGRDVSRDEELETLLRTEVLDPQKGVAYDFFESSVELATQVGRDIFGWLVRRHREATAELNHSPISSHEQTKLEEETDRLRQISPNRLPKGQPIDWLAHNLRAWFRNLGYGVESHDYRTDIAVEQIINIPRRRGYDRILVMAVSGEGQIHHLELLGERMKSSGVKEAWLVASHRLSEAARRRVEKNESNLYCYTFDELLDGQADFSGYLTWLENEVRQRGVDKYYIPLACTKEEFDPETGGKIGISQYSGENGWIDGYIDRWLGDPSKEHISILGEFGTGKTWFTLHYAWVALQRYRDAKTKGLERPRLPLLVPLRDYAKAVSVESLFSEFFFRKHEIPIPGYSAFETLNRMGKLLLIFDGFDEMAARVDKQKMITNFWELSRAVVPGSKAILTCRTEHFPDAQAGRELLGAEMKSSLMRLTGEPPQFEVVDLEKFDDDQIRLILSRRAKSSATVNQIMNDPQLLDLVRRPVMTEFVIDALPDIEQGKPIDLPRIYLYAMRHKMQRDISEKRTFTSLADKLYFLCELSLEMLLTDRMRLNYREFPDLLSKLFGDLVRKAKDLDHWQFDMHSQTMLIRNADGDYYPAHRSLLEFFVAFRFAAELGLLPEDFTEVAREQSRLDLNAEIEDRTWSQYFTRSVDEHGRPLSIAPLGRFQIEDVGVLREGFGAQPIAKAVSDLLVPILGSNPASAINALCEIIESSKGKSESEVGFLAANAVTLLVKIDPGYVRGFSASGTYLPNSNFTNADLREADFSGAKLDSALFKSADLQEVNFCGADLTKCVFQEVNLERANLAGANLMGISISDVRALSSVAVAPNESLVAAGSVDGVIYLWNTDSGTITGMLRGHQDSVARLAWSECGSLLGSWSIDARELIVWDIQRGESIVRIGSGFPAVTAVLLELEFSEDSQEIWLRTREGDAWAVSVSGRDEALRLRFLGSQISEKTEPRHEKELVDLVLEGGRVVIKGLGLNFTPAGLAKGVAAISLARSLQWAAVGMLDGRLLYIDVHAWLRPSDGDALAKFEGYRRDLESVSLTDWNNWPNWAKSATAPPGLIPNPNLGNYIFSGEQQLSCNGLRFDQASNLDPNLAELLIERGAVKPKGFESDNTLSS